MKQLRWIGTALCLVGMCLSAGNAYPFNLAFSVAGSGCWAAHGMRSRDVPLWVVELAAVAIGLAGLIAYTVRR